MNELNLKLQGKNSLVCDLYRIIKGFWRKLSLFEAQLEREKFSHFHCFKEFCTTIAEDNPFDCNLDDVPVEVQIELIDLQASDLLKEKHREGKLVAFYRCLPDDDFPKLKNFAAGIASVFGTTYVCSFPSAEVSVLSSLVFTPGKSTTSASLVFLWKVEF
ncbi:general transcription factor II-I repeat domain-containing protein 2B-like [Oratosquilla oratoria]|uniref:general transcription factor II-I repeat domain-containing protein 2B-like n=1 Tax=Oratosquilla oratoria TaxID=337810 RepID=UPI003F770B6F